MLTFRRTKPTVSLRTTAVGEVLVDADGRTVYFIQDETPGDVNGQGIDHFGGEWWVVSAAGEKITSNP